MPTFYPGQIVLANIPENEHNPRPVIIIKPPGGESGTELLFVTGISSSQVGKNLPPHHVLLPWHANGHPRTGLRKRCAAKCDWSFWLPQSAILPADKARLVPTPQMKIIVEQLAILGLIG